MSNWLSTPLGSICKFVRGPFGGSLKKSCFVESGFPVYEQQHAINDQFTSIRYFIDQSKFDEMRRFELASGDLIMSCSGTMGKVAVVPKGIQAGIINQALLKISPSSSLDVQYLRYWMRSLNFQNELIRLSKGVAIKNVASVKVLKEILIPLPSLAEQERIVAILDEAFAAIATATANAEKNLAHARELFESELGTVFSDAWQTSKLVALADLATDITDGDHMPPPKAPTGVPFITIRNIVKESREIDFSDTFMVPHSYFNTLKPHKKPKKGDVLYTVTGSFGIPVLIKGNIEFCFQRHIGLIRPKSNMESAWLYYLLLSPQVFKQANEGATGTAQKTVCLKLLRNFIVPKVTPEIQRITVAKLDILSTKTPRLETLYRQKLTALAELKQSILQKAFSGELTGESQSGDWRSQEEV